MRFPRVNGWLLGSFSLFTCIRQNFDVPSTKNSHFLKIWGRAGKNAIFVNCKSIACARCFFNSDLAKFLGGRLFQNTNHPSAIDRQRDDRKRNTTHARDHPLINHVHLPMVVAAVAPTTAPTAASARPPPQPFRLPQRQPYGPPVGARGRLWRLLSSQQ